MTAGRKPIASLAGEQPVIDAAAIHGELVEAALAGHAAQAAAHEETLELGKVIGRIETAEFYETISDSIKLAAFDSARKSKAYKNLINPKTETHFANIEEFCQVTLRNSARRMEQIAGNRNLIGQDLFEKSERLGLRQIDYNAIKALPKDDQALIQKAIDETDSRDDVLEILQELAARHQHEKEVLNKSIADTKAELAANKTRQERDAARINSQEEEISRLSASKPERTPAMEEEERLRFMVDHSLMLVRETQVGLRSHFALLEKLFPDGILPNHVQLAMQQACTQVIQAARVLSGDYGITLKLEDNEPQELLWLTQGEKLFGAASPAEQADDALIDGEGEA